MRERICRESEWQHRDFCLFFRAHPALGDMAGSRDILLMFGSQRDRNCWSHLLLVLFGYPQHRNCNWLLYRLIGKVGWITPLVWMCLLFQYVLSPEKFIATGWVWGTWIWSHANYIFSAVTYEFTGKFISFTCLEREKHLNWFQVGILKLCWCKRYRVV